MTEKWFRPRTHTGWRKRELASVRRMKLFGSTKPGMSLYERYLKAARRIQALSNVTRDLQTKRLAKQDADYFFKLARSAKKENKEDMRR